MQRSSDRPDSATRRTFLKAGSAVLGAGLLAGCTGNEGGTPTTAAPTTTEETETTEEGTTTDSYSVTMEPVGEVTFDSVPTTWAANNGSWADMGIALGQDPPEALYLASRYHTQYYDEIPGVSVDTSDMTSLWQSELDPEAFLQLGEEVELFVMDPNFILGRTKNWEQTDIDQIEATGTPFFANSIFSRGYEWHDYPYLSLYEAFEKLAEVFDERERYEAMESVHESFQESVAEVRPAEGERPSVAIMWPGAPDEPDSFSPYLIDEGTSFKQWRDLGVKDAFANTDVRDFHANRGSVDYELLLDIDPDVLLLRGNEHRTAEEFQDTVVAYMEDHSVASDLTAVKSGDVYRGGPLYQGPITNLVVTERAAAQIYDADRDLFDRDRVGEIVAGDF